MASTNHAGGAGDRSNESASTFSQQSRRTTRIDAVSKIMRGSKTSRGPSRSATYSTKTSNGSDRPEHPLSSISRLAAEEAAAASGGGDALGASAARTGAGGAGGGGHRRVTSDVGSSRSDLGPDRRLSHARDPLRRSGDTAHSDTPSMAERGGHGRDGPVLPRDTIATHTGGAGAGGGNASRGVGAGLERERTSSGYKVGEEELPMEVPGRYEKMRVLGRGSFGAVTLVKDNRDSKLYAMKTLNCADKLEERVTAMAEVRLLKWLKHPCVVTLFDVFLSADGRLVCLTTTYCESGDLAKIVKHASKTKSLLGEKTVLGWFAQLCLGVHNLHEEKKVLHRDIKPNNVFLMDSKKIIQLGDFGLAKVLSDGDKQVKAEVGTPYYTSPEMCNNQPYGFPSDVWSLGIVLFELLSLDVPFRSRDVVALVSQVIKAPPPPLPEVYSDEVTALARWMLQKDPLRRPTLSQALACQPLRRHMSSFVKHYRPMNMAERQRRHDIKDLEAQVASIIERGGDDPQIPGDVNDGCGTCAQDDPAATDSPHRAGSRGQLLEAQGAGNEEAEGDAALSAAAVGAEGSETAPERGAVAVDRSAARSPSTAGPTLDGHMTALRTDEIEASTAAAAAAGCGGGCARCGARVPCACGSGVRGAGGAAGGGAGGGGSTTPGRRFGSPQQSKGLRNVMSWTMGGSTAAPASKVRGSRIGYGDPGGDSSSSHDGDSSGGGRGGRRPRPTRFGEGVAEWSPSSSGGSGGSVSSAGSFNRSCDSHGSRRWERRNIGGDGSGPGGVVSGNSGARKRSRDEGAGGKSSEYNTDSEDSNGESPTAPARPRSPRSPRSHSSTRLKRVSGGGSGSGSGSGSGGGVDTVGSLDGDEHEPERTPSSTSSAAKDSDTARRKKSDDTDTGRRGGGEEDREGGSGRPARDRPPRTGDDPAASTPATATAVASAATDSATPSTGTEASPLEVEQEIVRHGGKSSDGKGQPDESPAASASGAEPRASHPVAAAAGERASSGGTVSESSASPPQRRRSSAQAAVASAAAEGSLASDHLTSATPRTPRSPRLIASGAETFKTAQRLSEALSFAASSSEEELPSSSTGAAAGIVGLAPRRESTALAGALAVVQEAAVATVEADARHGELAAAGGGRSGVPVD